MSATHTLFGAMQDGRFGSGGLSTTFLNAELAKQSGAKPGDSETFRTFLMNKGLEAVSKLAPSECGMTDCKLMSKGVETTGVFATEPAQPRSYEPREVVPAPVDIFSSAK